MNNIRILLVSCNEKATQAYLNEAKIPGIHIDVISSLSELCKVITSAPYQGVMIDFITMMKSTRDERHFANEILKVFPTIHLRWEGKTETIQTFYPDQSIGGLSLHDFIHHECYPFHARMFRSKMRKNIHFNVILSEKVSFHDNNVERVITINVSKEGCFLYSARKWELLSNVWFIIKELADTTPIRGEVRHECEWGKALQIPGIGVLYKDIKKCQLEEICCRYGI